MFKTMWSLGKSSNSTSGSIQRTKESLSDDLLAEVRAANPGARLSCVLRNNLERLDKAERRQVASMVSPQTTGNGDGQQQSRVDMSPALFLACKKGNLEIVEYLIDTCGADIEQKGTYEVPDDRATHRVTPLWCAAVSGRLNIVKCLVKVGANVNSISDTGSTPVRSACFMTHSEIVQYLVEHAGANLHLPNFNGGTCLINSVQSSDLCAYLLSHGANVNTQDIQLKTALHYAIQEHRFETTKLLLTHGADPLLRNRYGDDALQTSCLKGATLIFQHLLDNGTYTRERQAEMHELIGSTFLDEHHDMQMALTYWRRALDIRCGKGIPGSSVIPKRQLEHCPLYAVVPFSGESRNMSSTKLKITEFETHADLDALATDSDLMRINSLLIAERILGVCHKDVIFRMMYRGASYADSSQYILCIRLWRYALELRIQKDSLLYGDTCYTALALIRLYLDLDRNREYDRSSVSHPLHVDDLLGTFELIVEQMAEASKLVKVRPIFKRHQESFDRCLRCLTHMLYLLLKAPHKTREHCAQIRKLTGKVVNHSLKMCNTGDSLLHLAVSRSNIVRSHFFLEDQQLVVFPSLEVAKYLIDTGVSVNAVNENRSTPLHVAVMAENYKTEIVDLLLASGAHIDQLDCQNQSPLTLLSNPRLGYGLIPLEHLSLKCITSRAICSHGIIYNSGDLPKELAQFLELHRSRIFDPEEEAAAQKAHSRRSGFRAAALPGGGGDANNPAR